jgi:hypothetical protein
MVVARAARAYYGIDSMRALKLDDPEHVARMKFLITRPSGGERLDHAWTNIVSKDEVIPDRQVRISFLLNCFNHWE